MNDEMWLRLKASYLNLLMLLAQRPDCANRNDLLDRIERTLGARRRPVQPVRRRPRRSRRWPPLARREGVA